MSRVVITGISGLRNRGVEALLRPVLSHLDERARTSTTVLTRSPDYDGARTSDLGAAYRWDPSWDKPRLTQFRRRVSRRNRRFFRTWRDAENLVREASVVVAMGGDVFSSDYGDQENYLSLLRVACAADRPVLFLGQSIGPYRDDADMTAFKEVARSAALITARESLTERYLLADLGMERSKVLRTADPAFLLQPADHQSDAMRHLYGVPGESPLIVFCPSQGIASYSGGISPRAHLDAWVGLGEALLAEVHGSTLAILAHVQETETENDDRLLATQVACAFGDPARVRLVTGDHSAAAMKGLIAGARLVVSERMHSAIAGLSSGVCTIPISYSVKARGILQDLVGAERTQEVLIPVGDFVTGGGAVDQILSIWNQRDRYEDELRQSLPTAQALARANLEAINGYT